MVIPPLRRKVLRDLTRLWAQVLAIALVLACGVATLILGNGAYASLFETRARYYEDYRFADIFADVTRAPRALLGEVTAIEGVLDAEARIVKLGLLDLPGMVEPGSVALVSLPYGLNQLYLRQGRLPDPQSAREVAISADFAAAQGLGPGDRLPVVMNGQRRELVRQNPSGKNCVTIGTGRFGRRGAGHPLHDPLHGGGPEAAATASPSWTGGRSWTWAPWTT